MDFVLTQTYLSDILSIVSSSLLAPTIVLLLGFIAYAIFSIGSILVEYFTERRNFKVYMPQFLSDLMDAKQDTIPTVVEQSGLLNRQKIALLTVYDYRRLPDDSLVALIRRVLNEEDTHYKRIVNRNNIAVRVAPMLGLMGTLIPLGPGIAALGQGDVAALSGSLVVAFNTTVAGLASAAVCLVIARIRKTWYDGYMNALESSMATILKKVEMLRAAGEIIVEEPSNHAFLYREALKRRSPDRASVQSTSANAGKQEAVKVAASTSASAPEPAPSVSIAESTAYESAESTESIPSTQAQAD